MPASAELVFDEPRQFAFLAVPSVVRAIVPAGLRGAYLLLQMDVPFYVGRSDNCVQTRLVNHPLLALATHVAWTPCTSPLQAYRLESAWFHSFGVTSELTNQIHPASPAGEQKSCPFCSTGDCQAWTHLMRPRLEISAVSPVAADPMATAAKT